MLFTGITSSEAPAGNTSKELTQNRNVAQAPITSQMRQSVSAENTPKRQLSNLHSSTPTKSDHQAMDFSVHLSPIHHQRVSTPTPRTAMDLYAIIHESKKKILKMKGRSSPEPVPTTPINSPNWPKTFPSSQVPNFRRTPSPLHDQININLVGQYQKLNKSSSPNKIDYDQFPTYPDHRYSSLPRLASEESQSSPVRQVLSPSPSKEFPSLDRRSYISSPERSSLASDRLGRLQSTSRNDFKQLLLRANWGTAPSGKTSAVERLKNKVSSSPKKKNSWKSDVLSSTILEDCDEEDEQNDRKSRKNISVSRTPTPPNDTIPKSSALVSQQCKAFDQSRYSPTLETAL